MMHCGSIALNNGKGQIACVECNSILKGTVKAVSDLTILRPDLPDLHYVAHTVFTVIALDEDGNYLVRAADDNYFTVSPEEVS